MSESNDLKVAPREESKPPVALFARIRRLFAPSGSKPVGKPPCITGFDGGVQVGGAPSALSQVRWDHVRCIRTYKYDLFGEDEICVAFLINEEPEQWIEISENAKGFLPAIESMEKAFPSIAATWFNDVMLPPFETNRRPCGRRKMHRGPPKTKDLIRSTTTANR